MTRAKKDGKKVYPKLIESQIEPTDNGYPF